MRKAIFFTTILAVATAYGQAPAAPKTAAAAPKPATVARAAGSKSVKDLRYKPLKELKLPNIESFTLPNGLRVYLLENHELPLVRGSARIRTGNVYEPANKVGLTSIFDDVIRTGGTKKQTGDQLNELLEGIAATVEANVGETSATLSFNTLKENLDTVLDVFKDVMVNPEFRQDKIDVMKDQMRGVIARRNDQAGGIAGREFDRALYGPDTPWGRQPELATIDAISRQDLFDFHKRYFFPANIMLAVQGDFSSAEMRAKLEKLFADWTAKQAPVPALPPVSHKAKPGIYLAEKNEVNQTNFRIGHLGGKLNDKDYPTLEVMADILGAGAFSSRLMKKVRSDLGLAYNISANWHAQYEHPGTFSIGGSTKSESTLEALRATLGEVERIRTTEVTDLELQEAKESTLNSFVFNFDSPGKVLSRIVNYEYHGYPKDWIFQYQKAISSVTKADLLRVAKQYIKPEEFAFVLVGKPQELAKQVASLNMPIYKIDLTIPEPKKDTPKADAASLEKGKELLQKFQNAVGGGDKLAAVKDYMHTAEVNVIQAGIKSNQVTRILSPAARIEQQLPFGKIIIYADGKGGGWLQGPQGNAALPAGAARQAAEEVFRVHPTLWLSDRNPERQVNATGPNTVEISDKTGNWIKLILDPATNLVTKAVYRGVGQSGPVEVESTYDDWKDAGSGIKLPYKLKIAQGGKAAAEVNVQEYKLNSGIKAEDLAQKP